MSAQIPSVAASDYYDHVRFEIAPLLPAKIGSVLEIGCGAGGTMAWLRSTKEIGFAAGVEFVPAAGEQARAIFDAVEVGSVDEVPFSFPVSQFDLILALDVLEHLAWPDRTLKNLFERLRPGGMFIASIPNVANYRVSLPLFFRGQWTYTDEGHLDRTHLRFFSRKGAVALFEDAGLHVEAVDVTYCSPNIFAFLGWRGSAARWYSRKILRLLPLPSHFIESQYLIAARRPG
ncbi:class I SAM-dependent methyltransferase [Telmatospirillum sp.]|uniref:class I SAM-dependent methyltransferase n=1 Tax=Telmatospirillum sp. TaxID=2079197 RepID=UPI00284B4C2D|nr:class I SAM-dependent methyltransferase [Telmatospirillum sp.]MDR3439570.1 class I SAM-dependent methyltransferase [Telmatospirillum sp.]